MHTEVDTTCEVAADAQPHQMGIIGRVHSAGALGGPLAGPLTRQREWRTRLEVHMTRHDMRRAARVLATEVGRPIVPVLVAGEPAHPVLASLPVGEPQARALVSLFAIDEDPLLQEVRALTPDNEGGRPGAGTEDDREYPYGSLSFKVTTLQALEGSGVGGAYPVSIILAEDGAEVDGYVKEGPTPGDWRGFGRDFGWVGAYEFTQGSQSHPVLATARVGADTEDVYFHPEK